MRRCIFLFIALFVVCLVSVNGQIKVDEGSLRAVFTPTQFRTDIVLENCLGKTNVRARLEILDTDDKAIAFSETSHFIKTGKQTLGISIELNERLKNNDDILWQRLRYTISPAANEFPETSGIVALSEIMPEVFELRVSVSEYIYSGMKLRAHVEAFHPFSKRPVRNVNITSELLLDIDTESDEDELKLNAKGITNGDGQVTLEFDIPKNLKLDYDSDIKIRGEKNLIVREMEEDLEAPKNSFVYLNTDKPLYQPNQKLFVRGLYLDPARMPITDEELEFTIEDQSGEDVYTQKVKTSRFGVASIEWKLPENAKLGRYTVEVENDDGDNIGAAEFKVSRYDLPQFTVNAKTDKDFYLPDQKTAEITVSADYLFGKPVTNGRVRIVQEKSRRWDYQDQKYDIEEGFSQEGETNADGGFTTKLDLAKEMEYLNSSSWRRFEDLKFTAYFTDLSTNRTEQKRFDLRITKEAIHIYFIRYNSDVNPNIPFEFYVSTFYANGAPAKCKLELTGKYQQEPALEGLGKPDTNSLGAGKVKISVPRRPSPDAGRRFELKIAAKDKEGRTGIFQNDFYVDESESQAIIQTNKAIFAPGEIIEATITSTEKERKIYLDLVKDYSVIHSERVKLNNGKAFVRIPYKASFEGSLTLAAYYRDNKNETVRYSKSIIFPKPRNLKLAIKSDQNTYRPNQEARVSFKTDKESALGVVVFDKAIEERAKTDQDFGGSPRMYSNFDRLLGLSDFFGGITRNDLDNLDMSKPVSEEMQLAAEFLLSGESYYPRFYESDSYRESFSSEYRGYFLRVLNPMETALTDRHRESGDLPRDVEALRRMLTEAGIDPDSLRDAWGMPYKFVFRTYDKFIFLDIETGGADKKVNTEDDFRIKTLQFEWFKKSQLQLEKALRDHEIAGGKFPLTQIELKEVWKKAGIEFDSLKDGWGRPLYLTIQNYTRDSQKVWTENTGKFNEQTKELVYSKPLKEDVVLFKVRSMGADGMRGYYDDFDLTSFIGVIAVKEIEGEKSEVKIRRIASSGSNGAIGGTVLDMNGAVIPGANVIAKNQETQETFSVTSNDEGEFLIQNLPSGRYSVSAEARGFMKTVISDVTVKAMSLIELKLSLNVGTVNSVVEVTSGAEMTVNALNASVSTTVSAKPRSIAEVINPGKEEVSTPRVREYFPETLLWQPEILTDKNGRAEIKFKMADNLTTWKLYTIGSSLSGKIGVSEKEIKTFQPFFVDLDPPKVLTEGDEISLPAQVRNYTDKSQKVSVSMAKGDWFSPLGAADQQIDVAPNQSKNAVFSFKAVSPVKDGKQRVTALAGKDSDAIEKPVKVVPNGQEVVNTRSELFRDKVSFDVNFPSNALPKTQKAELKIYPNLFAHVAESVEGMLKRPYGCGEQTISSTYPNLMILKVAEGSKESISEATKVRAAEFLNAGYKRLLGYQTADGGFAYWANNEADLALTAYAIRFLTDADGIIEVDAQVLSRAEKWLISKQSADGSWGRYSGSSDTRRVRGFTAYITKILAVTKSGKDSTESAKRGLDFLRKDAAVANEPYTLANYAIAAFELNDVTTANSALDKLLGLMKSEDNGSYWEIEGATPFYSWGLPGRIETTALVIQAFSKDSAKYKDAVSKGTLYLLKNKDRYGVWYSTQATINVLNALITQISANAASKQASASLTINGIKKRNIPLPSSRGVSSPLIFDISEELTTAGNKIEISLSEDTPVMAQIVYSHYIDWKDATLSDESKNIGLTYSCNKNSATIMEEVKCKVGFSKSRYGGMLLAEIGLPPGAEVARESLENARKNWTISRYDILPDKIIVYTWASSQSGFEFTFRPRYGINAQTPASIVYDYYNPDAKAIVAPLRFVVK